MPWPKNYIKLLGCSVLRPVRNFSFNNPVINFIHEENRFLYKILDANLYVNSDSYFKTYNNLFLKSLNARIKDDFVLRLTEEKLQFALVYKVLKHLQKEIKVTNELLDNLHVYYILYKSISNLPSLAREESLLCLNKIERLLSTNVSKINIETRLLILDLMYLANQIKTPLFHVICNSFKDAKFLSPVHLTQLMFYISAERKLDHGMSDILFQHFKNVFYSLSFEQIVVINAGFFKSQNIIKDSEILDLMIDKLNSHISDNQSVTDLDIGLYICMLKPIRSGLHAKAVNQMNCHKLVENFSQHLDKIPLLLKSHLLWLACNANVCCPKLLTSVLNNLTIDIKNARLKDIAKTVWALSSYVHEQSDYGTNLAELSKLIIKEFARTERQVEAQTFMDSYALLLNSLCLLNVYPVHLIRDLFSQLDSHSLNLNENKKFEASTVRISQFTKSTRVAENPLNILFDTLFPLYVSFKIENHEPEAATVKCGQFDSLIADHCDKLALISSTQNCAQQPSSSFNSSLDLLKDATKPKDGKEHAIVHDIVTALSPQNTDPTKPSGIEASDFGSDGKNAFFFAGLKPELVHILPHYQNPVIYLRFNHYSAIRANDYTLNSNLPSDSKPTEGTLYVAQGLGLLAQSPHIVLFPVSYHQYDMAGHIFAKPVMMIRQLETLGYAVVPVHWRDFYRSPDRGQFLQDLIAAKLYHREDIEKTSAKSAHL